MIHWSILDISICINVSYCELQTPFHCHWMEWNWIRLWRVLSNQRYSGHIFKVSGRPFRVQSTKSAIDINIEIDIFHHSILAHVSWCNVSSCLSYRDTVYGVFIFLAPKIIFSTNIVLKLNFYMATLYMLTNSIGVVSCVSAPHQCACFILSLLDWECYLYRELGITWHLWKYALGGWGVGCGWGWGMLVGVHFAFVPMWLWRISYAVPGAHNISSINKHIDWHVCQQTYTDECRLQQLSK